MNKRQFYIDWIRVIAFGLLIFYHTGMFFVSWGWHVKNNVIVNDHKVWMSLINPWRLPLLFFISGVGVSFAMKSRTMLGFWGERTKRLLLPLIFGMLVVVPPQIYFERLQQKQFAGSYADFYPSVFEFVPYPEGNFSWHHLWFVAYLWVYSIVAAPLFVWLKRQPKQLFREPIANKDFFKALLFAIPLMATYWTLHARWKVTHNLTEDWYNLTLSLLIFVNGYVFGIQQNSWEVMQKYRKVFLGIAVFLIGFSITYDAIFGAIPEDGLWILIINGILKMLVVWCMILAIGGFAKQHFNFENNFVRYANRAVYPFYILHQTITVSLGFYLADSHLPHFIKFVILVIGTFGLSWFIYHFLIRPFAITRLFFGVK